MRGTLVLVVGPSGVGKDSLIAYCRSKLGAGAPVRFPRRVITRAMIDETEAHHPISEDAFHRGVAENTFALHWRAHGLAYGVPVSAMEDLANGYHIVINVSRSIIDEARRCFAPVMIVSVDAAVDVLVARLHGRGREPVEEIRARLRRAGSLPVRGADVVTLDNTGPLDRAGEILVDLLRSLPR